MHRPPPFSSHKQDARSRSVGRHECMRERFDCSSACFSAELAPHQSRACVRYSGLGSPNTRLFYLTCLNGVQIDTGVGQPKAKVRKGRGGEQATERERERDRHKEKKKNKERRKDRKKEQKDKQKEGKRERGNEGTKEGRKRERERDRISRQSALYRSLELESCERPFCSGC